MAVRTVGMGYRIDDSELATLEADLSGAPLRVQFGAEKQLLDAARMVNRDMRRIVDGHLGNWFGIPGTSYPTPIGRHVSHEMVGELEVEIGVEKKGAGKLAHILAYGSVNNDPVFDHTRALTGNLPRILAAMADVAEDSVLGGER